TSCYGDKINATNNKFGAFQFSVNKMNINRIWFWIMLAILMGSYSTAQRHEIGVISGGVNYIGEIGSTQYI